MKFSFTAVLFLASTATAYVNRTLTNGWGSTPAQRHYITAEQAQMAIRAAVEYSNNVTG